MTRKPYREERTFVVRFTVAAEFPEDYAGDEDGFEWAKEWNEALRPGVVKAVLRELRTHPRFRARIASRGADPDREVEVAVDFVAR
jgi:hypothetical protein